MNNKKLIPISFLAITLLIGSSLTIGFPSVYPTGTTIYDPEKAWNGYVIHDAPDEHGTVLVDMNGNVVKQWTQLDSVPGPSRILPGGYVIGAGDPRRPHQEANFLMQLDWDGNEVWRYDQAEQVMSYTEIEAEDDAEPGPPEFEEDEIVWSARQHHDWQREGSPAGYYSPESEPLTNSGKTLVLAHKNVTIDEISHRQLEDDYIYELSWDGEVLWEWLASDHVEEFGFSENARNAIHRSVNFNENRSSADWLHINSLSYIGPNQWYDSGDERFHPDNVMISARAANFIAIINREGDIVWRIGPDYRTTPEQEELGQIIGQHNPHIIPKGLPGEGNLLVFDNGGSAGYGFENPASPNGVGSVRRDFSRVLEFNPVTLEVIWQYALRGSESFQFFSSYVSNAQRLPNGNTMVNEGADGRIFELTAEKEIVWEYMSPFVGSREPLSRRIFRAYRVPYDWIPQLDKPTETPVIPPDNSTFRVPAQ